MKIGVIQPAIRQTAFAAAVGVNLLIAPKVPAQAIVSAAIAPRLGRRRQRAQRPKWNVSSSLARTFPQQKRPVLIRWIRIVRQTSKNWAFAMQRT